MKSKRPAWSCLFAVLACAVGAGESRLTALPPEAEIQRIFALAPDKAAAMPKKPRRVLSFWRTPGFKHTVIPVTNAAIEVLGRKTGAYQTVISEDPAMFEADKLAEFDAVILNNTCGIAKVMVDGKALVREVFFSTEVEKMTPEERKEVLEKDARWKKNFEEFVRGGKGLVGIHGAVGAFFSWAPYGEMIGGYFKTHPPLQKIGIKIDDPAHVLCVAFGGKGFEVKDEAYIVGEPFSREKVRVLLTIDESSVAKGFPKGARADGDYAAAWIKTYGQGRVFYSLFSHSEETFLNPAILKYYLDGIQFALGDLEADTTPSAKRQAK
jgi:type 1 glutamine amidotransferase